MVSENETIVGLGARGDYVAPVPNADPVRLRLTADEARLLTGIGRIARIEDVLKASGMEEARAIAMLLSLRAKGAIAPARYQAPNPKGGVDAALNEEVDLPPDRKKEIFELDRSLDTLDHYALLGIAPGATSAQAKQAYYDQSRKFHPDRFYGKNLGSYRGRIERIFRRLTDAEKVLTDPDKRGDYLKANPHLSDLGPSADFVIKTAEDEQRDTERRARFAKHPYLMKGAKVNDLVNKARRALEAGEAAMALADVQAALQIDPKHKDALTLQGEARKAHELHRAASELERAMELEQAGDTEGACDAYRIASGLDSKSPKAALKAAQLMIRLNQDAKEVRVFAQRAVDLEPKNADAHFLLASVLDDAGMKKLAQKHFEEAFKLNPDHPQAKKRSRKFPWPF